MKPEIGQFYINNHGLIVEVRAIAGGVGYVTDGERIFTIQEWQDQGFKHYAP